MLGIIENKEELGFKMHINKWAEAIVSSELFKINATKEQVASFLWNKRDEFVTMMFNWTNSVASSSIENYGRKVD